MSLLMFCSHYSLQPQNCNSSMAAINDESIRHAIQSFSIVSPVAKIIIYKSYSDLTRISKVNSVQEACAKFFSVHILEFEILQTI